MKFLIDEQLPQKLASWLNGKGFDAIHADDVPHTAGKLTDIAICKFADEHNRIVIVVCFFVLGEALFHAQTRSDGE